jgi:hypothetical protein
MPDSSSPIWADFFPLQSSKKVGFKPSEDRMNDGREILGRPRIAWIGDENGLFAFSFLITAVQLSVDA